MRVMLGQQVVVDNRAGAGGVAAASVVSSAPHDGHTLILFSNGTSIAKTLLKLPYDPQKDFAPIAQLTAATNVISVHPSVPANTLKEFIAYAKQNPGKINYASDRKSVV